METYREKKKEEGVQKKGRERLKGNQNERGFQESRQRMREEATCETPALHKEKKKADNLFVLILSCGKVFLSP